MPSLALECLRLFATSWMLSLESFGGGMILELGNYIWSNGIQYANQRVWVVLDIKNSVLLIKL